MPEGIKETFVDVKDGMRNVVKNGRKGDTMRAALLPAVRQNLPSYSVLQFRQACFI